MIALRNAYDKLMKVGSDFKEFKAGFDNNNVSVIIIIFIIYCLDFLTLQVLKLINYCASHNW